MKYPLMNEAESTEGEGGSVGGSLLSGVQPVAEAPAPESSGPAVERPEWVLDKYATADRSMDEAISEQAKAYVELQKQFGAFTGAPESYELAMPEGVEGEIDTELPQYQAFLEIAKEANMNNDTANQLFSLFVDYQNSITGQFDTDLNAQKELLGPEADQRISTVASWLGNNVDAKHMGAFETMTHTADQIEAIEALIAKTRNTPTPKTNQVTTPVQGYSESDFHADVGSDRYRTDSKFRAQVRKRGAQLFGVEG